MRSPLALAIVVGVMLLEPSGWAAPGGQRGAGTPRADAGSVVLRNGLVGSTSPYLRAAAMQPVHWQEWGDDVFALARRLDKPIYLDIGAVWCHWCHEIDRESYENAEIAILINESFIPVRVDRDVRPDIDKRYQAAVTELAGQGGWPLIVFLTPDGDVFYGGTYQVPAALRKILVQVADGYRTDRNKVKFTAEAIRRRVASASAGAPAASATIVQSIVDDMRRNFDAREGGFSSAPKFPSGTALALLVERHHRTGDRRVIDMATRTLDKMAAGGVRDQLSGRFHRYATDALWRLPHFEVMLYTQAEMLSVYLDAYALTGQTHYREVAEQLLDFVKGAFANPEGGFHASQDADASSDDDGSYYTWSAAQLRSSVSGPEAAVLERYYDIRPRGEMAAAPMTKDPSQNVLWVADTPEQIARDLRQPLDQVRALLQSGRRRMIEARQARPAPAIDRTILSDWNGLMVSAFFKAYTTLGDEPARAFALKTLDFVVRRSFSTATGMHHALLGNERVVAGLLDDQVMMARALLDAYEVTGDVAHLARARQLMSWTVQNLWDSKSGGFFDSRPDPGASGLLTIPHKPVHDTPTLSGNAAAADVLNRLHYLTQENGLRDFARRTIESIAGRARTEGTLMAGLGMAAVGYHEHPPMAVIIGRAADPLAASLHRAALTSFRPGKIVMRIEPDRVNRGQLPPVVRPVLDSIGADRWPLAFVCSATSCALPTASPAEVTMLVRTFGRTTDN